MSAQTQTQTISVPLYTLNQAPSYSFLSKPPPPPQKKRPTQPLPSPPVQVVVNVVASQPLRRRSNTFSTIASWAAHVQPGSPGSPSPRSPRRRPSVTSTRRPSITRVTRRPSITHTRVPSGSFLNILDTPTSTAHRTTPSIKDFDLTNLGYTSVFVRLPYTPSTPAYPSPPHVNVAPKPPTPLFNRSEVFANIPIPPIPASPPPKSRTLKHFRSLTALKRPRSKSATMPPSPQSVAVTPKAKAKAAQICAVTIAKRKKAKYAYLRPPPLANELAMMQFADGGSMDSHVKRVMEAQAKAAAGSGQSIGVGDVFRDGKGGLWWDQEEEWEYAHLLSGEQAVGGGEDEMEWVQFGGDKENEDPAIATLELAGEDRRGSVSTQDSDLDSKYIMQPAEEHAMEDDGLAAFGGALAPLTLRKPGMSVLSLPSRPRRTAKHLRKPEFLIDIAAFGPSSPKATRFGGPHSPIVGSYAKPKPKGMARRRPAPLKLTPPSPGLKRPSNSPVDHDKVRRDFLEASFEPAPASARTVPPPPPSPSAMSVSGTRGRFAALKQAAMAGSTDSLLMRKAIAKKPSRLNMKGLLRSVGAGKRDN